ASVAADCLKALVPFFFFAAIRNRMWSQAIASILVWGVVSAYSLTSALGHAALNRFDMSGHRAAEAQSYKDLRADLERAKEQLGWIPQHRPIATVENEIEGLKTRREWGWSNGCAEIKGPQTRSFCQQFHTLSSELASAQQAAALEVRIADVSAKLAQAGGGSVLSEADPQAKVLADLSGRGLEEVQMALTIFIALLLEIGSGLGMYIAFSQWRLYDRHLPTPPVAAALSAAPIGESLAAPAKPPRERRRPSANDNRSLPAPAAKLLPPEDDVQRFYKERIETQDGASLTATSLYEDYCQWCEENGKEPLALPTFGRDFGELGVQKAKIAGRIRYIGIALKSGQSVEEDKKLPAAEVAAA
ncbi:MAG TPA: primase-like DNA-binding domain-containing protein, partial [Hyphomicrobiaceae bacterium]|nr:primase-like DNA-binding domain-containing protein [Hyphomicrobiaceae bacterium]